MKAVNLIPPEERRGAGGAAGRTGGGAYVLFGALTLMVAMLAAYATTTKSLNDQEARFARIDREATVSEATAVKLAPYTVFAGLRAARVATVKSIADSRFDWAHAMHELGRTLPKSITLTALTGSVSKSSSGGGGVALRAAYDVPAIELNGCAPGQAAIPPMLASLRQVDGVRRVALQQSIKGANGAAASTTSSGTTQTRAPDCRRSFQAVIFFDPKPAPAVAAAAAPGAAPTAGVGTTQTVNGGVK
ncbi:MAG: hypothetical protein JWO02_2399 [Solirubrobacterales bacterium]|nr:hypothetical protein [Solirubrobacterales bacterium]